MKFLYIFILILFYSISLYSASTVSSITPHFLYQFAKNIKKPTSHNKYHLHIISQNKNIKKDFLKILRGKKINNRVFEITQGTTFQIPALTDMLYVPENSKLPFSKISDYVEGKSILLISFNEKDKKRVMLNLFLNDKKSISFEINRANILNAGFSISDKVVLMGGTELDIAKLFKGAKNSLIQKEALLKKNKTLLQKSKKKLNKISNLTKKLFKNIKVTQANLKKEKKLFKIQKQKNQKLQKEILETSSAYDEMQKKLYNMSLQIQKKSDFILKRENSLVKLNKEITDKKRKLTMLNQVTLTQSKKIKTQEGKINQQNQTLLILLGTLSLFLILIFIIIYVNKKQRDISAKLKNTLLKLKDTQEELIQREKMASLGELVSGLAHELNTPIGVAITGISVIKNSNSELQQKLKDKNLKESDLITFFEFSNNLSLSINVSLQKAAQLVRSFKQVSVDQQIEVLRDFDLKEYLNMILISIQSQLKHSKIQITFTVEESIKLNSYPGIYYQIITNLINNSIIHAFDKDKEGSILIEAKIIKDKLQFTYKDNGKGVSEENLPHIFDPFFTTKRGTGGTGLGLHIIYNLITQKLSGTIKAESIEAQGLKFTMILPLINHE